MKITKTNGFASCTDCGQRVRNSDIKIGSTNMTLCKECLEKLHVLTRIRIEELKMIKPIYLNIEELEEEVIFYTDTQEVEYQQVRYNNLAELLEEMKLVKFYEEE